MRLLKAREQVCGPGAVFAVTTFADDGGTLERTTKWTAGASRRAPSSPAPPTKPQNMESLRHVSCASYQVTTRIGETQQHSRMTRRFRDKHPGTKLPRTLTPIDDSASIQQSRTLHKIWPAHWICENYQYYTTCIITFAQYTTVQVPTPHLATNQRGQDIILYAWLFVIKILLHTVTRCATTDYKTYFITINIFSQRQKCKSYAVQYVQPC